MAPSRIYSQTWRESRQPWQAAASPPTQPPLQGKGDVLVALLDAYVAPPAATICQPTSQHTLPSIYPPCLLYSSSARRNQVTPQVRVGTTLSRNPADWLMIVHIQLVHDLNEHCGKLDEDPTANYFTLARRDPQQVARPSPTHPEYIIDTFKSLSESQLRQLFKERFVVGETQKIPRARSFCRPR